MNVRIETNFKELKEYEEIESYYDYLEQVEHFFRDIFGDRVESQKYIIRANKEIERLNNIINELEKLLEEEQDRLARETSNIYEDSLGKTRLVNENIYEEVQKIKDKLQGLKGDNKDGR